MHSLASAQVYSPRAGKPALASLVKPVAVAALLSLGLLTVLLLPVEVPDTSSPPEGNHAGSVEGTTTIGQTFVPIRNGLSRIDLVVSNTPKMPRGRLAFQVRDAAWKRVREVVVPISSLPLGKVGDLRPGTAMANWSSFQFEPIDDSADRELYLSLAIREPSSQEAVGVLMFFHNRYPLGQAYVNGDPANGYVVFRSYARGRVADVLAVWGSNLVREKQGILGSIGLYAGAAAVYLLVSAWTILAVKRSVYGAEAATHSEG